jgi:uncharacterized protein (DUF488 family)
VLFLDDVMTTLYTIGHSTHTLQEFVAWLQAFGIELLIDVRTIPKSRHVPWTNKESLKHALQKEKISYLHMPELGGFRHPKKDSINLGWRNSSFRGYADYMQTKEFYNVLMKLNSLIKMKKAAIMCAEALPWRCHRTLIADAEIIRGIKVKHIMSKTNARLHQLTPFAMVDKTKRPIRINYPIAQEDMLTDKKSK